MLSPTVYVRECARFEERGRILPSSDFLASDYHMKYEVWRALQLHSQQQTFMCPILLRPFSWKIHQRDTFPGEGTPSTASNRQTLAAWQVVAQEIRE